MSDPIRIIGRIDTVSTGSNVLANALAQKTGQPLKPAHGWIFSITLTPWRAEDGAVQGSKLAFEVDCDSREEGDALSAAYAPGAIIALDASEPPAGTGGCEKLGLLRILGETIDDDVSSYIRSTPAPFVDPEFGEFCAEPRLPDDYNGRGEWSGTEIEITLVAEGTAPEELILPLKAVLGECEGWDVRLREAIAERYYDIWLETWREDAHFLDREAFKARFVPEALSIYGGGEFELMYADDDLFLGHSMMVSVSDDARKIDVAMCG